MYCYRARGSTVLHQQSPFLDSAVLVAIGLIRTPLSFRVLNCQPDRRDECIQSYALETQQRLVTQWTTHSPCSCPALGCPFPPCQSDRAPTRTFAWIAMPACILFPQEFTEATSSRRLYRSVLRPDDNESKGHSLPATNFSSSTPPCESVGDVQPGRPFCETHQIMHPILHVGNMKAVVPRLDEPDFRFVPSEGDTSFPTRPACLSKVLA